MRLLIMCILFSFVGCKHENRKQPVIGEKQERVMDRNIIPDALRIYINNSLPSYTILTEADYSDVGGLGENNKIPFLCETDFNGDGNMDYAILLKKGKNECCLVLISPLAKSFSNQIIDCFSFKNKVDITLSIEKKGKWKSVDGTISVPNDGILVEFTEESLSKAYYWDGTKFVNFLFD